MKTVFLYILLLFISVLKADEEAMCGYHFFAGSGWLKLHIESKTWQGAVDTCAREGSKLAGISYPGVADLMAEYTVSHKVKAIHTDVDPNIWQYWRLGRPLREDQTYILTGDGIYKVSSKSKTYGFFCHNLKGVIKTTRPCGDDSKYHFDARTGKCYKFHTHSRMYDDALEICLREGAMLVIINSDTEAQVIREIFANNTPSSIRGLKESDTTVWRDIAFVGIFKMRGQLWTLTGNPIESTGYNVFEAGEPNNRFEGCISVGRDAKYSDDPCERPEPFICEMEPDKCSPWWYL